MFYINKVGESIPRFYLLKGKSRFRNYIKDCEVGACMYAQQNALMTKELIVNCLCHFVASIRGGVSHEDRHLLIFDGHGSDIYIQIVE